MAPVLRAALVLCVMLAAAPYARTQDMLACEHDMDTCSSTHKNALQNVNSQSEICRVVESYFTCVSWITSCGDGFLDIAHHASDRARARMRKDGCAAILADVKDPESCNRETNNCISTLKSALRYEESDSEICRAFENTFTCLSRITICGSFSRDIMQAVIEKIRVQLLVAGCGAEGTAVVSVVTLLLSLAAALVWGQS